ncbi:MAG TPA: hypothetical protein VEZ50_17505 [Nodosilinea sp.]|jgi:hypothetical protein|nr:hypothetical protein [Nodosilinea sp.]
MKRDPNANALAIWLIEQQQASQTAQPQSQPGELHLHQHHHAATPPPVSPPEPQTVRLHPLFVATYMLFLSVAISVPLALIAAIVDSTNRPSVQYVQPERRGW